MTGVEIFKEVITCLKGNSNWLIPLIITTVLAVCNLKIARANLKIAENQRQLQNSAFCYQLFEKRMEIYTEMNHVLANIITEGSGEKRICNQFFKMHERCSVFIWR